MSALSPLENSLNELLVVKGPKLPEKAKKIIVQYLPYLVLLLGFLTVLSWWSLWSWGHVGPTETEFAKEYAIRYNTDPYMPTRMSFAVWAGLTLMAMQIILYYAAFFSLSIRKKTGWDMLFYLGIVSLVYTFFLLFLNKGISTFLISLLESAVGFYFLFQIRSFYTKDGLKSKSKTSK